MNHTQSETTKKLNKARYQALRELKQDTTKEELSGLNSITGNPKKEETAVLEKSTVYLTETPEEIKATTKAIDASIAIARQCKWGKETAIAEAKTYNQQHTHG